MSELYPEAIYGTRNGGTMTHKQRDGFGGMARRYAYNLGYAEGWVDRGKSVMPVPAGWSNLTEAIKAGERIDWERLDGVEAKCVHPELGVLARNLARRKGFSEETANGWCEFGENTVWEVALPSGWHGIHGWSLYIKGDLPLRKQTADQLEPGTCFRALYQMGAGTYTYTRAQVIQIGDKTHVACFSGSTPPVIIWLDPADIEVLEVYGVGTYPTPKEN